MKKEDMSCIDCAVKNCNKMDKTYPDFCLTTHMDEEVLNEAMECYNEDDNRKVTIDVYKRQGGDSYSDKGGLTEEAVKKVLKAAGVSEEKLESYGISIRCV